MNLVSCMRATRLLLPMLLEAAASDKRGATLVFISSMIALNTAVAPGHSAYIASKTVSPFAGFPWGSRACLIHCVDGELCSAAGCVCEDDLKRGSGRGGGGRAGKW